MCKRVVAFVMAFVLFSSLFPLSVDADNSSPEFRAALKTFLSHRGATGEPSEETCYMWSYVISVLKADGMNNNAIAGIMGNVIHESMGSPFAVEGHGKAQATDQNGNSKTYQSFQTGDTMTYSKSFYPGKSPRGDKNGSSGNGHGIIQWSYDRAESLTKFCEGQLEVPFPSGCGYVTVYHWEWDAGDIGHRNYVWVKRNIPDLAGQMVFMLWELKVGYSYNYYRKWYEQMQVATSASEACEIFRAHVEVGGSDSKESRKQAAEKALKVVEVCTGTVGTAPSGGLTPSGTPSNFGTEEGNQQLGAYMVSTGMWSETQLAAYCSLTETNLEETLLKVADRSNLGQSDLEGLTDWERNHDGNLREHGYIAILRWCVSLAGILMTIWALFVYLAFWFDHINTFFYLDVLHILTFGQLHICQPGEKPTFSVKTNQGKAKTVDHLQIVCICMTAILFGCLLISGVFYTAVAKVVHIIQGVLK